MKNICIYTSLFLLPFRLWSQTNLVPNYSFEDTMSCPSISKLGMVNVVAWYSPTKGTPDYYNQCSSTNYASIPNNRHGGQVPYSGVAYVGIATFNLSAQEFREYIEVLLNDSLKSGKKYHVDFYLSLGDSEQYICNDIGVYFSNNSINAGNYSVLPYIPQVSNANNNMLSDKLGWTKISKSFIANGGEKYITIGNFKNDANSDTMYVGGAWGYDVAYYYIDDISVIEDTATGVGKISNEKEKYKIKLYPNPNDGGMQLDYNLSEGQTGELIIYNMMGEKINTYHLLSSKNNIKISEAALKNGVYFYELKINNASILIDKIVIIK